MKIFLLTTTILIIAGGLFIVLTICISWGVKVFKAEFAALRIGNTSSKSALHSIRISSAAAATV